MCFSTNLHTVGSVGWLLHIDTGEAYIQNTQSNSTGNERKKLCHMKNEKKKRRRRKKKTFTLSNMSHCSSDPRRIHRFPCSVQLYLLLHKHAGSLTGSKWSVYVTCQRTATVSVSQERQQWLKHGEENNTVVLWRLHGRFSTLPPLKLVQLVNRE